MDRTYHSHKSCRYALAPLCHHSSITLASLFSSACLPCLGHVECPLALTAPHTLTFLPSNVWANLTLIKTVLIAVKKNGCGNCGVSGPVEDRNCLCELVVGTSMSLSKLCHYNQRDQNMYWHITHTKCHPLAEHSCAKPQWQLKENRENLNEWSLCCSLMVLKTGSDQSVYL